MLYKRQYNDKSLILRKCMYIQASGAIELRKFWHFHILKLLFPSISLLVLHILCLRNIKFQVSNNICIHYTITAVSFYYLRYVLYINDIIPTNTNIEEMYVCERASLENFGIFTFLNCYFFQYFVGTSDTLSVQMWMTCLSVYMCRLPRLTVISPDYNGQLEGGAVAPRPPPPLGTPLTMVTKERKSVCCSARSYHVITKKLFTRYSEYRYKFLRIKY